MIDIKSTSNTIRFSTPINEGSKRKFLLMKEDYITLKFSVDKPVYFKIGDGIDNELGVFELVNLCKPAYNSNTGGYDYELRLDAYYWKWKNNIFKFTPEAGGQESSWNLTASLDVQLKIFLRNLTALDYKYGDAEFTFSIDGTVENKSLSMSYDKTNLLDALTKMAEAWECEWWILESVINFGRREHGDAVDFELGKNVDTMTRSDSQSTFATRICAFGSTRNVPTTYRKKLEFEAKQVNGRDISDTSRVLNPTYFLDKDVVPAPDYTKNAPISKNQSGTYSSGGGLTVVSSKMPIEKGAYTLSFKNINRSIRFDYFGGSAKPVTIVKYKVMLSYKDSKGEKVETLVDSEQYIYAYGVDISISIADKEKSFPEPVADLCVEFIFTPVFTSATPVVISYNINGVVTMSQPNRNKSAKVGITFLNGVNSGNTLDGTLNPDHTDAGRNLIRLPEGKTASVDDRYKIDNIVESKVPTYYFTNDIGEDLLVNGIVQRRLMLPVGTPYIDAYPDMSTEEAIEDVVVFEEIYPRRTGTISDVTTHEYIETIKEEGKPDVIKEWNAYRFKDSGIIFFEEYRLADQELKIIFQSGALNGMEFAVKFNPCDEKKGETPIPEKNKDGTWNPAAQVWEIVRNEDYGRPLPDEILCPQMEHKKGDVLIPADTYILFGFDTKFVSDAMIPAAEKELKEKAEKYVEMSKIDPSTYDVKMMSDCMVDDKGQFKQFNVGDKVNLINSAYFETGSRKSRIIGFEYNLDIPWDSPVYTVGETASYSRLGDIESKLENISYKGQTYAGAGGGVYLIKKGDPTTPTDNNTFSALRILAELLKNNEELKNLFISSVTDDEAAGLITLLKGFVSYGLGKALGGLEVGEAIKSLIAGKGTIIDANGYIEAESMALRSSLTVLEVIFNRMSAMESDYTFSEAGTIDHVELLPDGTYNLPLRKRWENDFTALAENDVVYGVVNDLASGGGHYYTSWLRVLHVDTSANTINAVMYPDSEVPGGQNHPPEPLMILSHRGNPVNEDRQGYWYLSSREKCICMLDGVRKPILEEYNYSVIIGKMKQLALFDHLPIGYRDSYIFCRGFIGQDILKVDVKGTPIVQHNDRSFWTATPDPAYSISATSADVVWHVGCKWLCLIDGTKDEPMYGSTGWTMIEGNPEFTIDIKSSAGWDFDMDEIVRLYESEQKPFTVLNVTGRLYNGDVTAHILDSDIEWKRDSSNVTT